MQRAERHSSPGGSSSISLVPPPAFSHACFVSLSIIPMVTAEPPNPAMFPPGTPGSRASCAKGTFLQQQRRYCNGNNAVYNPINPTSFCAGSSYVMLMLTRCATLRDSPGNQRPSKWLVFYIALWPQPLLINARDEPPAIASPAATGCWYPPRLPLPAPWWHTRLSPPAMGAPHCSPPLVPAFVCSSGLFIAWCRPWLGGMPGAGGSTALSRSGVVITHCG